MNILNYHNDYSIEHMEYKSVLYVSYKSNSLINFENILACSLIFSQLVSDSCSEMPVVFFNTCKSIWMEL